MEPDAFMIWKRGPFFVEIHRFVYSDKVMQEKVSRYETYFVSNEWQQESWQPETTKVFPTINIITNNRYCIENTIVKFIQIENINNLVYISNRQKQEACDVKVHGSIILNFRGEQVHQLLDRLHLDEPYRWAT
jgi:hypothetical protein